MYTLTHAIIFSIVLGTDVVKISPNASLGPQPEFSTRKECANSINKTIQFSAMLSGMPITRVMVLCQTDTERQQEKGLTPA